MHIHLLFQYVEIKVPRIEANARKNMILHYKTVFVLIDVIDNIMISHEHEHAFG